MFNPSFQALLDALHLLLSRSVYLRPENEHEKLVYSLDPSALVTMGVLAQEKIRSMVEGSACEFSFVDSCSRDAPTNFSFRP
jgi:hypothetical protein